jgi:hypothetical protein
VIRLLIVLVLIQAAAQTLPQLPALQPPGNITPGNTTPGNATPGNTSPGHATPPAPLAADPAAVTFTTEIGVLLVAVKPTAVADYEAAIVALQEALAKSTDAETRQIAEGWRVYKADLPDAKSNALYVHLLQPAIPTADYRPSLLLDKLLAGAPADLLAKYRDSFAIAPTKLSLTEFAHMAVAPVPKPANASPDAPVAPEKPAKPGNASPAKPPGGNDSSQLSAFSSQRRRFAAPIAAAKPRR